MKHLLMTGLIASLFSPIVQADIKVSATALSKSVADRASINFTVVNKEKNSKEAIDKNQKDSSSIFKELTSGLKLDKKNIQTGNFSVRPQYIYLPNNKPKFNGIEVRNEISVSDLKIEQIAEIVNLLSDKNINEIGNINFYASNQKDLETNLLSEAFKIAKNKAEILAKNAGLQITRVLHIDENPAVQSPVMPMRDMRMKSQMAESSAIFEGSIETSKEISVIFETK